MSKGIHDPWRLGTDEWEPPPDDRPAGTKGSKLPFDWDLQPELRYVLRAYGYAIRFTGASSPEGAVAVLIRAFLRDEEVRRVLTEAGFEHHSGGDGRGFTLKIEDQTLACPQAVDMRDGFKRLYQALQRAVRGDRSMKERLRKLGITPLIQ